MFSRLALLPALRARAVVRRFLIKFNPRIWVARARGFLSAATSPLEIAR